MSVSLLVAVAILLPAVGRAAPVMEARAQRYRAITDGKVEARTMAVESARSGTVEYAVASNWSNFLQCLKFTRDAHNPILSPTLEWEGANIADPVVIEEDTELRMYYSGFAYGDSNAVGLATSPQTYPPTSWTKQGAVFSPSRRSGRWDSGWVRLGNVFKSGSTYYLYYVGTSSIDEVGVKQIGLATSTNGINFRRHWSNPILTPSDDEIHVEDPTVIQTDATHWYMYYSYRSGDFALPGIRVATSADGVHWTKVPGDVLSTGSGGEWDDTYIEHSQIYYIYDHYVLVYEGYGGSGTEPWAIGMAYSTSPTTNFTKFTGNPFFQKSGVSGAFDRYHVATPSLFCHDGAWHLFFQGGDNRDWYGYSHWQFGVASAATKITTPSPLAAGAIGVEYHQALTASGGTEPYAWTIVSGSLPLGLSLSNDGVVSGTSEQAWVAHFRVRVTSADTLLYSEQDFSLTIQGPMTITKQPANQIVPAGSSARFIALADGDEPLSYQWQKDGVNLTDDGNVSGATTASLTIAQVVKEDKGDYRLVVMYSAGFAESDEASLTVIDPVIVAQPANQFVVAGSNATFEVTAVGTALQYQWQRNTTDLADATNASLVVSNASWLDDGAIYRAVVSNSFGSVISSNATLSLDWSLRFLNCFVNSDGLFQARLVAPPGSNVVIQCWLQGSPWTSFATNSASNGIIEITEPMIYPDTNSPDGPASTNRFYRAWLAP